jgi:DNA-directed RNA polymerase specialized sigma24 family protein
MPKEVHDLDAVLEMCGFGRAVDDHDGDRLLWHLVKQAETCDVAARIVLHRILPALMAMAKRRGQISHGGMEAAMSDILSTAWCVIREYPHHRRHHKVAANLVRDTEYHAFVRHHRLRHVDETQVGDEMLQRMIESNRVDASLEIVDVFDEAVEMGVETHHLELLREFASGRTSDDIAARLGVSSRTVRNHKRNAVDALRDAYARVNEV